jgi:hypothetical protein
VGDWLVAGFTFLGIFFQNWMPITAGIVALFVLYLWIRARSCGF